MRALRLLGAFGFFLAGIALPIMPSHAAPVASSTAFAPSHFTVVDEGTVGKPDVVLIPGMSSSRSVWDAEAKLLAPNYRLHLVQLDGFAGAPAGPNASGPLLAPVVEELHAYIAANKMHPVVIGHSMGGLLALMLADKHPEDVRKMVIVDTPLYYAVLFNPAATVETMKPQAEAIRQQMLTMPADQFAAMTPMMAAQMVKNPEGQKLVAASYAATDRTVFVNALYEDMQTDLRSDAATIKTPTLLLFAVDAEAQQPDPVKYEAMMREAYKPMPNVTLVKIEGSRHFIMYDQPEKFDAAVEGFLR